jgi:hypothetical protein
VNDTRSEFLSTTLGSQHGKIPGASNRRCPSTFNVGCIPTQWDTTRGKEGFTPLDPAALGTDQTPHAGKLNAYDPRTRSLPRLEGLSAVEERHTRSIDVTLVLTSGCASFGFLTHRGPGSLPPRWDVWLGRNAIHFPSVHTHAYCPGSLDNHGGLHDVCG